MNEGAELLRCWLEANDTTQAALGQRMAEWAAAYRIRLGRCSKSAINHLVQGRRRPTLTQAVAIWHIAQIEPGSWLRQWEGT